MSFDMNPLDEDPHGECRHEIHELTAENARLRRRVERLVPLVRSSWNEGWKSTLYARFEDGDSKKQLDAILADEPGEAE